jgi:hypothetical protein
VVERGELAEGGGEVRGGLVAPAASRTPPAPHCGRRPARHRRTACTA